jgi:hypothetical protein
MNKIIKGLKEAVRVSTCDHELALDGAPICDGRLDRTRCTKCTGLFWTPVSPSPQETET